VRGCQGEGGVVCVSEGVQGEGVWCVRECRGREVQYVCVSVCRGGRCSVCVSVCRGGRCNVCECVQGREVQCV